MIKTDYLKIFENIEKRFNEEIKPAIEKYIVRRKEIYAGIKEEFGRDAEPSAKREITDKNRDILQKEYEYLNSDPLYEIFTVLINDTLKEISAVEDIIVIPQDETHFRANNNDLITLRLRKKAKNAGRELSRIVRFDKDYNFKRRLPLRNLYLYIIYTYYFKLFTDILENIYRDTGNLYLDLYMELRGTTGENREKNDQKNIYFNDIPPGDISSIHKEALAEFDKIYKSAGTLEHPAKRLSGKVITDIEKRFAAKIDDRKQLYESYIAGVFDRLRFLYDIYTMNFNLRDKVKNVNDTIKKTINDKLTIKIGEVSRGIKEIIFSLENLEKDSKTLLEEEKKTLAETLNDKLILDFINLLHRENLPGQVAGIRQEASHSLVTFDKQYTLVKTEDLKYGIKKDDFKSFNPYLLYKEAIYPEFRHTLENTEAEIRRVTESSGREIIEISRIADYNLETALSMLDSGENSDDAVKVAVEGLERAVEKSDEIKERLGVMEQQSEEKLNAAESALTESNRELLYFDKLLSLRLEISREKTKRKIRENSRETIKFILFLIPRVLGSLKKGWKYLSQRTGSFRKTIGLEDERIELTSEISDYLISIEESISSLPKVYQRLFSTDTLTDKRFFVGRQKNLASVGNTIKRWEQGYPSNIAITGEKGEGASTLLNFALEPYRERYKVLRTELRGTIYSRKELAGFLSGFLQMDPTGDMSVVEKELNKGEKRIIVLENIEDLFLRIVGGFEALESLYELMAATNRNNLWITTCNIYSWNYLSRTADIGDYFTDANRLEVLTETETEEMIMKRHSLSGYNTEFIPSPQDKNSRKYRKASPEQKQEMLRNNYFSTLKAISRGNVSLALLQWLRSIERIEGQTIYIEPLKGIDFSFLKLMSAEKLFILMAVLLHDGLTIEECSKIFRIKTDKARLLLTALRMDGILFYRNERYKLNFLIYRNVVNVLKDRNILH